MEYKENGTIAKKTYADFKLSCDSFSRMLIAKELFKAHYFENNSYTVDIFALK